MFLKLAMCNLKIRDQITRRNLQNTFRWVSPGLLLYIHLSLQANFNFTTKFDFPWFPPHGKKHPCELQLMSSVATFVKTKGDESLVGASRTFPLSIPRAYCFIFICPFKQILISLQSLISPDFLPTGKNTPANCSWCQSGSFF